MTQTFSIKQTAENLVPDKLGRTSYVYALLIILIMILVISLLYGQLPGSVPLYFSLPWGESRLAPKFMLYIIPLLSLVFLGINLGLGRLATKLSPILPRILAIATMVTAGMMLFSIFGIMQSLLL